MRLLLLLPLLCLIGCTDTREKAIADSSATIYEAWEAHKAGVPDQFIDPVIKQNSMSIIHATGYVYAPGEKSK